MRKIIHKQRWTFAARHRIHQGRLQKRTQKIAQNPASGIPYGNLYGKASGSGALGPKKTNCANLRIEKSERDN